MRAPTRFAMGALASLPLAACGLFVDYDGYHIADGQGGSGGIDVLGGNGGGGPCPTGQDFCGGVCIDVTVDPQNCGACDVVCTTTAPSTAACEGARCVVTLASVSGSPGSIALDATHAYFTNAIMGKVHKVPIGGGNPVELATSTAPGRIAVNASYVVWEADASTLRKVPLSGSASSQVATTGGISALAVDASSAYYASGTTIYKVSLSGGTPTTLLTLTGYPTSLAVVGSTLYFTYAGAVESVSTSGGTTTKLAWDQGTAYGIGVTASNVYWSDGYTLRGVAAAGGEWVDISTPWSMTQFVTDAQFAYGAYAGSLQKATLASSMSTPPVELRANVLGNPIVDDNSIYWLEAGNGVAKVMKLTPK